MRINALFIIKNGNAERLPSYYYKVSQQGKNELFDNTNKEDADYYEIDPSLFPLPTIKQNQKAKYIRENKSFLIRGTFAAWDKNEKEPLYSWDDKFDLYLSCDDVEKITPFEEMHEYKKGCKEYALNYRIVLKKPLFLASAYDLKLYKTFEEIPPHETHNIKELKKQLEKNRQFWTERHAKKGGVDTVAIYESKIKEGFIYETFGKWEKLPSCEFVACCGIQRVEKSQDYKHAEKLTEEINKHIYKSNELSIYEVLELLQFVNISIKRKGAK